MNKLFKNGRQAAKKMEQAFAPISTSKNISESGSKAVPLEASYPFKGKEQNSFEDIPGPWPSLPMLGTNWQYFGKYSFEKLHEANFVKYHKYGHIFKEEFKRGIPFLQLYDPEDFITVFRNQGKCPIRPPHDATYHYRRNNPQKYKSVGLTNAQGEEWRCLRNAVSPFMLDLDIIKGYLHKQNEVCEDFISLLHNVKDKKTSTIMDFQRYLYRLALESISILCLDARIGCLHAPISKNSEASEMIKATQGLFLSFQLLYYGFPFWKYFKSPAYKLLESSEEYLFDTASKYIREAMRSKKDGWKDHERKPTVLESLVRLDNIDPKDVRMTLIDFMVAGIDTVSNTLTFVFNELAQNQIAQQRLWEEINKVLPNKQDMTRDDLGKIPYLNATIKEVFRLSPTIPGVVRITNKDHVLSGYKVPKNTTVFCHSMIASRLEKYFTDPESFKPERWLMENCQKDKNKMYSVLPFGFGARMCIGRRFAEQEIKATLVKVLQNFRVELANREDPPVGQMYRFLVVPDRELNIKLVSRI